MRNLLYILSISFLGLSLNGQNTVGLLSFDESQMSQGYNLIFPHNQSNVYLLDNCGRIVHQWEDDNARPGNAVYLLENGDLIKCKRDTSSVSEDPIWAGGGGGIIEIRSWENDLLWFYERNDEQVRLHHDVAPMPNGNILVLAWELIPYEDCIEAGRDTAKLVQNKLWSDFIFEINPESNEIVWEWHAWDHLVQDFDSSKSNYSLIHEMPERIDVNYETNAGNADWLHSNAIDYNPVLDQIMISIPHFSEIWIIDHSTTTEEAASSTGGNSGKGGDLLFRWGNPAVYQFQGNYEQRMFFQHDAHWVNPKAIPGAEDFGEILFFNNRTTPLSTVSYFKIPMLASSLEYPEITESLLSLPYDRTIEHPEFSEKSNSTVISSAQKLANGNTLICSGRWGYGYEVTPTDEIVWEYITPLIMGETIPQGTELTNGQNFTYQMKRYHSFYGAFENRDLSAKGYIEQDPFEGFCDLSLMAHDLLPTFVECYPNPANDLIHFNFLDDGEHEIVIFNLKGKVLKRKSLSHQMSMNIQDLPSGLYYVQIDESAHLKLIKI